MLHITVKQDILWDENKEEFVQVNAQTLSLEHSLVSISKWEAKYHKPFLSENQMSQDELEYYIRCMTITQNVPSEVYVGLTPDNYKEINSYIEDTMTATTVSDGNSKGRREVVTSELIYYWMVSLGIPFECQKWHLNRLIMLIRVCNAKNQPEKKMNTREIMNRNRAINKANRQRYRSRG